MVWMHQATVCAVLMGLAPQALAQDAAAQTYDPPSAEAPTRTSRPLPQPMRHVFVGSFLQEERASLHPPVGVVQDADFDNIIIRPGDHVRVSCTPPCQAKVGDSLFAFAKSVPVKHPISKKPMGDLLEATGMLMVTRVKWDGLWAQVVSSVMEIERGQSVAQATAPMYQNIEPKIPSRTLKGNVVAMARNLLLGREERLLFVDLGRTSGVEVGDTIMVRGRRDTVRPPVPPKAHVEDEAQIVVVAVGEQVSTAIVADGLWEVALGDPVFASF